ncbi:MAG: tyrosine-specific transport protein 1 [Candidatus Parcubacteria bacterium]|nr:hypothetical protein [Patescibacteria group bacterium]BCX15927.1 MAG: tyrosine-specific transport protein 1 [Candidatus Parcubacteria bacterium]
MSWWKEFVLPASLLAGTIIGAGIFSLPFVFLKAGLGWSFPFLFLAALVFCLLHLMYADLVVKNGDHHRFAGLSEIYFGREGYWLAVVATVIQMFFVLVIYLYLAVSFFSLIFPSHLLFWGLISFWLIGSLIIFLGTRKVAFSEFLAIVGILAVVFLLAGWGIPQFLKKSVSFSFPSSPFLWFLPFGPLLFSLSGRPAIPALIHYFRSVRRPVEKAKRAIIGGTLLSALVYLLFVFSIIGLSDEVSVDSISGISANLPSWLLWAVFGILGVLSLLSSYFAIGLDVRYSLEFDLKFSKFWSIFLVVVLPLVIYALNVGSFLSLIEFAGGVFVSLEGIMILLMWRKSLTQKDKVSKESLIKKVPFWIWSLMMGLLIGGMVYTFLSRFFNF